MKNIHSSDGIAEDLIRAFVQVGCAELHTKTLIEKCIGELEQGICENDDDKLAEVDFLKKELDNQAKVRRSLMLKLFDMYDGDKGYWCEVKHLGIGAYTLFEAYQGSDDDVEIYMLALEANKLFIKALTKFLGVEITDCASCFADLLKAQGKDGK